MPDPVPAWLATMRQLDGTKWAHGDGPNPTIKSWLSFIGTAYPNMAAYCNSVASDEYFFWCGLTVGYCMAQAKIAPVFGATELTRFLYAAAWLGWGTPVTTPQLGDVLVFNFGSGDHHVTLFEKDNGDGTYSCHGGNQSNQVMLTNFRKSNLMGIRRPIAAGAAQPVVAAGTLVPGSEGRAVTALQTALTAKGFDAGGIDGEFGPLTSAAVSDFQRASNLPVTGIADAATLNALALSPDGAQPTPVPEEPPVQPVQMQDLLNTVVNALIAKQQGTTPSTTQPATSTQASADVAQLVQAAIAALAGQPLPTPATSTAATTGAAATTTGTATGTTATTPPVLSVIDQLLGGQSLVGMKTMLAVIAYVIVAILEATGTVDAKGTGTQVVTDLITAFGALGGLAKVDRLTQALGQVASQAAAPPAK